MKQLSILLIVLLFIGIANCSNAATSENGQPKKERTLAGSYELYPTDNMWTFIKLDTRNGKMWQVQFSIQGDEYRFETPLNLNALANGSTPGRFELYPTKNMFNFVLLDKFAGYTWQVQWSTDPQSQRVIPIK